MGNEHWWCWGEGQENQRIKKNGINSIEWCQSFGLGLQNRWPNSEGRKRSDSGGIRTTLVVVKVQDLHMLKPEVWPLNVTMLPKLQKFLKKCFKITRHSRVSTGAKRPALHVAKLVRALYHMETWALPGVRPPSIAGLSKLFPGTWTILDLWVCKLRHLEVS